MVGVRKGQRRGNQWRGLESEEAGLLILVVIDDLEC